jgi:hypothetical protein
MGSNVQTLAAGVTYFTSRRETFSPLADAQRFAPIRQAAGRLVCAHWGAIGRVAAALAERGSLTGAEIDALMRLRPT